MTKTQGLQHFIEQRAAGPAFAISAACVIARGATFWSGGAFNVAGLLGTRGLHIFDALTGIGIGVGSELLASIFGRQWQRYGDEAREAEGRAGLRRAERAALVATYRQRARLSAVFMTFGLAASASAGFAFLHSTTGAQGIGPAIGELAVTLALVLVLAALGIFYERRADDAGELATEQARGLRARIVEAAGQRIARGEHTSQDVRLLARALPKREQERFMSAMLPESADDPTWTVADIASWLGADTPAGRRQLHRRLARLAERGAGVVRDDRGRYSIARSDAVREFSSDFVELNRPGSGRRSLSSVPNGQGPRSGIASGPLPDRAASTPRQLHPAGPQYSALDTDSDGTATVIRQPA